MLGEITVLNSCFLAGSLIKISPMRLLALDVAPGESIMLDNTFSLSPWRSFLIVLSAASFASSLPSSFPKCFICWLAALNIPPLALRVNLLERPFCLRERWDLLECLDGREYLVCLEYRVERRLCWVLLI